MIGKDIIAPSKPEYTTSYLRDNDPNRWAIVEGVVDELLRVAMQIGNSTSELGRIRQSMYQSLDSGLIKVGLTIEGELTMLMWHFTKGAYLPMIPECFNRIDSALTLQISNYMLSQN